MRPNSLAMDELIAEGSIPVLDHGFIRVVDYMGNDDAIVQAARVSYNQGCKTLEEDSRLIKYLMKNKHTSPFEMCEIKLHVKLPIFVARQWVRHRTASINEVSARYTQLPNEFYIPDDVQGQSMDNKQGRDGVTVADAERVRIELLEHAEHSYALYERFLGAKVARELARLVLPANVYTEWYWKIDLHNLLHFVKLRSDKHAQWEIQQYADVISDIVECWVPRTWEAFTNA